MRNSPASTKVREEGREEVLQVLEQGFPCSLWERPHRSRFILKDCSLWEGSMLKQEKSVRRKGEQRGAVVD